MVFFHGVLGLVWFYSSKGGQKTDQLYSLDSNFYVMHQLV